MTKTKKKTKAKKAIVVRKAKQAMVVREGSSPAVVIQHAVKTGASVEQLEKLLILQERYDANEAKKAYNVAMTAFKENPPEINKDRTVKYSASGKDVKYNHASLYNVTKKLSSALSKHNLSATWSTKQGEIIAVTCKITHKQGHSEETTLSAPADNSGSKNAIQAIGSTITYLERYTLLALTGLTTFDQDNDGATVEVEYIDDKQKGQLLDYLANKNIDIAKFCKAFKVEELSKLPKNRYKEACLAIASAKGNKR